MAVITNNGSNNSTDNDFYINSLSNDGACETFDMRKSRAGGVITSGDSLGAIFFSGFDGSNYIPGAKITSTNSGTVGAGRVAANMVFLTHPDSASAATTRMTIASTGQITIATPDSGTALTISGGGCSVTGTVSITAGNLALPTTSSTAGNITVNGTTYWNSYGTNNLFLGDNAGNYTLTTGSARRNFIIGTDSGSAITTASNNSSLGYRALRLATSGSNNVTIGNNAGENITTSSDNIAIGDGTLGQLSTGSGLNTVVGPAAGGQLGTGTENVLYGYAAGYNYTTSESNNIIIGSDRGVLGESNVTRIGFDATHGGIQTKCFIDGIYNKTVGATAGAMISDSSGQIGSISGTSSQVLLGGTKPSWGQVDLTTQVTGVLPIANGGTNASSMATTYGVNYFDGTRLVTTAVGSSGQVLTSNGVGVAPTFQSIVSGVSSVTGTANQVTASPTTGAVVVSTPSTFIAPGSIASTTSLTAGNAFTVTTGTITLTPLSTSGIVLNSAAGVISTGATTNHAVQVGNSSGQLTSLAVGTSGQLLQSAGAADPGWTTATYPSTAAQGDIIYASASNTLSVLNKDTNATRYLANTGTSNNPAWNQVNLANGVTGTLPVGNGGTGNTTFTAYSVICAGTTSTGAFQNVSGLGTSGQVLTSNGAGALPTWQAAGGGGGVTSATGTANQITVSAATGAVTWSIPSTFIAPGSIEATSTVTADTFVLMPATSSTAGQLKINSHRVLSTYGDDNTFVGYDSGLVSGTHTNSRNSRNTAIGYQALGAISGSSATSALQNTVTGWTAAPILTDGYNNTFFGANCGQSTTTGAGNNCIGSFVGPSGSGDSYNNYCSFDHTPSSESNVSRFGNPSYHSSCFIAGISGVTVSSSATVLINTSTHQLGTIASSERYKENIEDMNDASSAIMKLRPVTFNYKKEIPTLEKIKSDPSDKDPKCRMKKTPEDMCNERQVGLIAEEVEKILPSLVAYDKDGLPQTVKYHELPVLLLNEIKKLVVRVEQLEAQLAAKGS